MGLTDQRPGTPAAIRFPTLAVSSLRGQPEQLGDGHDGAVQQLDEADEAGASVGASPLIQVLYGHGTPASRSGHGLLTNGLRPSTRPRTNGRQIAAPQTAELPSGLTERRAWGSRISGPGRQPQYGSRHWPYHHRKGNRTGLATDMTEPYNNWMKRTKPAQASELRRLSKCSAYPLDSEYPNM